MSNTRVIADIDLSLYFTRGKTWLRDTVSSLKKAEFVHDERLVFRLDQPDIYDYATDKGEIESYLDQLLDEFDIPSYFVVKQFLAEKNIRRYDDTKCALPWVHLYVMPGNGNILPCCIAEDDGVSNVSDHPTVSDAVNSVSMKKIRAAMMQHQRPINCQACYRSEDLGFVSSRMRANREWPNVDFRAEDDGSIEPNFKFLHASLDNICNFKCRTCDAKFSSSIEQESKKIWNLDSPSVTKNRTVFKQFNDSVLQGIDNIERFTFSGGEPLLMQDHYDMLDALLAKNRTEVELSYVTNFSNLSFKNKHVLDYWNQFRDVNVMISLDAMESRAQYIRHGTVWKDILANITIVREKSPHVNLIVTSIHSIYNCFHLMDFQRFLLSQERFSAKDLRTQPAIGDNNSLGLLPISMRSDLKQAINDHLAWLDTQESSHDLQQDWRKSVNVLDNEDLSHLLPRFLDHVKLLDAYRQEDFFATFPELAGLKNYIEHNQE